MNSPSFYSHTKLEKAITSEQFNQIIEAILAGKYSWACFLILRFAGYNPLHYIPEMLNPETNLHIIFDTSL
ncbi:HetP family heterocyst commitment protein [Chroococcidiopsis sp. FACHB-1243]|nr:HetP family heterocyst commitment protein [Chroococcidiopsis sp. [FACHB-1243]]